MPSRKLRFAVFGAGFWTRYQLAAWRELRAVECVAIYSRTRARAEAIARECAIPKVYDDPESLLLQERPDFVDNITGVDGHKPLSLLCAQHRTPCICQKPLAATLSDANQMVTAFRRMQTPFFVHENWRWQTPIIELRRLLRSALIGPPIRARLTMVSGFDCWTNQPALRELEQFILTDLGTHLLDVARALFGEARSLYCQTRKTLAPEVRGENVATLLLSMGKARTSVLIELGYAKTPLEAGAREVFPQTLAFVEGPAGSIELCGDYGIKLTTADGTRISRHPPAQYAWADPAYEVVHASIVECHRNLLGALRNEAEAETTSQDNLKTLELVYGAYQSAARDKVIRFKPRARRGA